MCWKCGSAIDTASPIRRSDLCPDCGEYLHCCRNCRFYDGAAHYECRETIEEPVRDKEAANFCDFFSPALKSTHGEADNTRREAAKKAFDSLFSD